MASIDNIGFTLKTARESFNKSLFDLSKLTNLSVKQLSLLEENKFDEIGEGVFVIGFLRIYAKVLRINPNLIIESYRANYENMSISQSSEKVNEFDNSDLKNITFLKKTVITIFITITAFILIFLIEKNKPVSPNINSVDKLEQSDDFTKADIKTNSQIDQSSTGQAFDMNDSPNFQVLENDESSKISLKLLFTEECWIEVRDINGNIVNSSVNQPDSELSFESNLPLSFIFGNAEGVALYISGVIFDHKPFTKVSVARFTITNNE